MKYKAAVITLSDKAYHGEREDLSGKKLVSLLENSGLYSEIEYVLLSDDRLSIASELKRLVKEGFDLVLTTGGTGLSGRDNTPEATKDVIDKEVPGISELIRYESFKITKRAALSRAVSGIAGKTLIINMPGSLKAVTESYEIIKDIIPHALETINSNGSLNCGR